MSTTDLHFEFDPAIAEEFFSDVTASQWQAEADMQRLVGEMLDCADSTVLDGLLTDARIACAKINNTTPEALPDEILAETIDAVTWFISDPHAYITHHREKEKITWTDGFTKAS